MKDPNPHVKGGGHERLIEAGIDVTIGVLERDCKSLNEFFVHYMKKNRPFVIWKSASTFDGKTATSSGDSKWITNEQSRRFVHRLRSQVDAVAVGIGTALADDPQLTCRLPRGGKNPVRIIVDSRLRISPEAKIFRCSPSDNIIIATLENALEDRAEKLMKSGAVILRLPEEHGKVALLPLLHSLGEKGIMSILLEGGMTLASSFMKQGLIDKACLFYAPKIIGGGGAYGIIGDLGIHTMDKCLMFENIRIRRFSDDLMVEAYPSAGNGERPGFRKIPEPA